jgi:TBC1 domain family member 20
MIEKEEKLILIEKAIKERNVEKLKKFCQTDGGLYSNKLRKEVWTILLDVVPDTEIDNSQKKHTFSDQIDKDVERSMWKFIRNDTTEEAEFKRNQLRNIMNSVMNHDPSLYYFQGFHDICTIFLFVCGEKIALACVKKLTILHLKDSMSKPALDPIIQRMEKIFELINQIDPGL